MDNSLTARDLGIDQFVAAGDIDEHGDLVPPRIWREYLERLQRMPSLCGSQTEHERERGHRLARGCCGPVPQRS